MNTPTEAHLDLALQIAEALARSGNVAAAQLIADSEARETLELRAALALGPENCDEAYDELRADCDELRADVVRLTAERDQLRAEVKRLKLDEKAKALMLKVCNKSQVALDEKAKALMLKVCNNEKARAARAEAAETVALARWNGALERAMKAEADLVALGQCHDDNCRAVVQIDAELSTERARGEKTRTALKDAISTYFGADKLVTAERIEAWQAAL